jgi:hypothetical protein
MLPENPERGCWIASRPETAPGRVDAPFARNIPLRGQLSAFAGNRN